MPDCDRRCVLYKALRGWDLRTILIHFHMHEMRASKTGFRSR